MEENIQMQVTDQQSLVEDSFSSIERLEVEMKDIENKFQSLDNEESGQ
jgi:uncharacterized protein (UPF0335 family)